MTVEIIKLAEDVPYSNVLVYGDSGSGKTVLAGSDERVLFIAPEDSGTLSALRMGSKADKIPVHEWLDVQNALNYLYDHPEITEKYDWVVIDSAPEMQSMCMRYILKIQRQERIARDQDPEQPQIQDYGKQHILFDKMIRGFNDLPTNVLYTATARKVEDADGNEFLVPDIAGKDYGIAMKTVALMTSYGYLKVEIIDKPAPTTEQPNRTRKVKQRVIYWEDTGTIRGKDRTTRLAPKTILPSKMALKHLRGLIDGTEKAVTPAPKPEPKIESVEGELEKENIDLVEA